MFMQSKIRPKSRLPSIAAAAVIGSFLAAGSAWAQMDSLSIMAPASPGGGWDGTARAMQQALQKENIVKNVEVTNVPGAGGTIGLAQFAGSSGQGDESRTRPRLNSRHYCPHRMPSSASKKKKQ